MMDRTHASVSRSRRADSECPDCGEGRVRRVGVFEHVRCGFTDVVAAFGADGPAVVCPKCDATFAPADEDLRCVGFLYDCSSCDHRFDAPVSFASRVPRTAESD